MEKIKAFFSTLGGYVVAVGAVILAVLAYIFVRKQDENTELKAQLNLANTHKEVDIIETEIKAKAAERQQTEQDIAKTQKDLDLIEQKRQDIKATKTDSEIETYWDDKNSKK